MSNRYILPNGWYFERNKDDPYTFWLYTDKGVLIALFEHEHANDMHNSLRGFKKVKTYHHKKAHYHA